MIKPKFYIDMDGVLAVWNQEASEEETHEIGYFLSRDVEASAVELVKLLHNAGHDVCILSSVYQDDHSAEEKSKWLDNNGLADIPRIFVPYGEDKNAYIKKAGTLPVLIDDYTKNLRTWDAEGYLAFKFMNGFNNQPKLGIRNNTVYMKTDSWNGYSVDNRMTPQQMFILITSVANTVAADEAA